MPSLMKAVAADTFGNKYPFPRLCDYVNHHALAAGTAESDTVPAGAKVVVIATNLAIYVIQDGTATVPAGDVTDGTGKFYLPPNSRVAFALDSVTTISVIGIAAETPIVTFEYYA